MALYYVYYAIQKDGKPKVGASSYPKRRKRNCKYQEIILLEAYACPIKCGDREIELQQQYFGTRDSGHHYAVLKEMLKTRKSADKSIFQTEEFKTKMSESFKLLWENEREYMLNTRVNGSNHYLSKLTEQDIKFIRKAYFRVVNQYQHTPIPQGKMTTKQLADKFNCVNSTILKIVNGKRWKHVK